MNSGPLPRSGGNAAVSGKKDHCLLKRAFEASFGSMMALTPFKGWSAAAIFA